MITLRPKYQVRVFDAISDSAQVGISAFKVIGDLIKWVAAVLAAIAILWAAASHGLHKP